MGRSRPVKVNNFILCECCPNWLHLKFYPLLTFLLFQLCLNLAICGCWYCSQSAFNKHGNLCGNRQTLTPVRVKIKPAHGVVYNRLNITLVDSTSSVQTVETNHFTTGGLLWPGQTLPVTTCVSSAVLPWFWDSRRVAPIILSSGWPCESQPEIHQLLLLRRVK